MFNLNLSWVPNTKKIKKPYYENLFKFIARDIASGVLPPNYKMPSQRDLSYYLDIHFTTVTRVYKLAIEKGLLYGIKGKGTFVSPNANINRTITFEDIPSNLYNFGFIESFGKHDNNEIKGILDSSLKKADILTILKYHTTNPDDKLRLVRNQWMKELYIPENETQEIIATNGGQSGLTTTLLALFNKGDKIVVDRFTYSNFIELSKLLGLRLVPIETDSQGMRIDRLEELLMTEQIKGVYIMPLRANPTNAELSLERRLQLSEVVKSHELLIIEDDYIRFINPSKYPSLLELAPQNTVSIISTSKALAPGLRIGLLIFDKKYKEPLKRTFVNTNSHTSTIELEILFQLSKGNSLRELLNYRLKQLQIATNIFNNIFNSNAPISFHQWIKIPQTGTLKELETNFIDKGIEVEYSTSFSASLSETEKYIRVSLASTQNFNELEQGLINLKSLLDKL